MGNILLRASLYFGIETFLIRLHKQTTSINVSAQEFELEDGSKTYCVFIENIGSPAVTVIIGDHDINNINATMNIEATIEYPVRDDGTSPMWDMNQIVYIDGKPRARQIR